MYFVGYGKASNSDENVADSQYYLTMVRSGTTANAYGAVLFIGSGKNMNKYVPSEENLVDRYDAPSGYIFLLNENEYMTDSGLIISTK